LTTICIPARMNNNSIAGDKGTAFKYPRYPKYPLFHVH
jgi:hypothetical protein